MMTIAIPTASGQLHSHFGGCQEFTFVQVDTQQRKILNTRTLPAPEHTPGAFPRWVREQGASLVIAGGIGQRAMDLFAMNGIIVRAGQPQTSVETLVAEFLAGALTTVPTGCTHHDEHGHHHDH